MGYLILVSLSWSSSGDGAPLTTSLSRSGRLRGYRFRPFGPGVIVQVDLQLFPPTNPSWVLILLDSIFRVQVRSSCSASLIMTAARP
jgi:hypothetical protein